MNLLELALAALFTLLIGSFLNVCIYRIPRRLSVSSPRRSFCPHCNTPLSWWENIPVLSWLFLGAKCRHCRASISGQYPLVELLSAIAGAATYLYFGLTPVGAVVYVTVATLIVISFIDLEFRIIPNVISFPGMTLGLLLGIVSQFTAPLFACSPQLAVCPVTQSAFDSLFGFALGWGIFYLIGAGYYLATKRVGLGGGDIKLMGMTGAVLGWHSVFPTIFTGALIGSVVGIVTMCFRSTGRHTEIPFGPWLSLGAILYIFQLGGVWEISF